MKHGLIIITLSIGLLCSCSFKDNIKNQTIDNSDVVTKPLLQTTLPPEKDFLPNNSNASKLDIKDFTEISKIALKSNLTTIKNTGQNPYPMKMTGDYDLNMDNKPDKIEITFNSVDANGRKQDSVISINGFKKEFSFDNPTTIWIVDLDKNDKYSDIAVLDDGPSGDPNIIFFRYTGTDIVNLGAIHETVLINSTGKALSSWNMANFKPKIILSEYNLVGNKIERRLNDITHMINKDYAIPSDMQVEGYFKEMNSVPDETFSPSYQDKTIKFTKGETFTLRKIKDNDGVPMWYYVEFKNGKKGVMYFWMGD